MVHRTLFLSAALAVAAPGPSALAGTSADYRTDFETTGMSAGAAASAHYAQRGEAGAESAPTGASPDSYYRVRHGFAGQIYEVQSVALPPFAGPAAEDSTLQLHPLAYLDDLTVIDAPDRFFYGDLSPWTLTSPAGLVSTGAVVETVSAGLYINFEDVDNSGTLTISDTDRDNYGAFGGDGVTDAWQTAQFGPVFTPAAAGRADADGDGMDNAAEFARGTDPRSAASVFSAALQTTPGGTTQVTYGPVINPAAPAPRLKVSADLLHKFGIAQNVQDGDL